MNDDTRSAYNELLVNISEELDIPPSKYQQAVDRYKAVGRWLQDGEYAGATSEPEIYTQGSFRLGTVVRPIKEGKEADYDIDLVCELQVEKDPTGHERTKKMVGDRLASHDTYKRMLDDEGRRCWTLKYAEEDGVGFHLDVLPSVPQDLATKRSCVDEGVSPDLADQAIAITHRNGDGSYKWDTSNPGGFANWFHGRMAPAFMAFESSQKRRIFESHRELFASIAEVPDQLVKTPLQRAIQILKRHRDCRFAGHELEHEKPISMIITTTSAILYGQEMDVVSTLENIINSLVAHAGLLSSDYKSYRMDESLEQLNLIRRRDDGTWDFPNPVNPGENFAERWHEDGHRRARAFFLWVTWAHQDLVEISTRCSDIKKVGESLEETFGRQLVNKAAEGVVILGAPSLMASVDHHEQPVQIHNPSKPWGSGGR